MNANLNSDLAGFFRFLSERVQAGETTQSPEELLDEWRDLHPDSEALEEDIAAVQEAIDHLESGNVGVLFEESAREFRLRHNLPDNP